MVPGTWMACAMTGVGIAPVPLQRLVHPHRVAAGAGEDLVDRADRAPHRADLGASPGGAIGERHLLARVDHVVDPVDVGQESPGGRR